MSKQQLYASICAGSKRIDPAGCKIKKTRLYSELPRHREVPPFSMIAGH